LIYIVEGLKLVTGSYYSYCYVVFNGERFLWLLLLLLLLSIDYLFAWCLCTF